MSFDGNGTYIRTDGVRTGSDIYAQQDAADVDIDTSFMDFAAQDIADALSNCVTRDGQSPATADLPMGGFKHENVAAPTANNEYQTKGEADKIQAPTITATGGTDALVGTYAITIPALVNNMSFKVRNSAGANTTTTPTYNPDALGATTIKARGGQALQVGDLGPAEYVLDMTYYSSGDYLELENPYHVITAEVIDNQITNPKLAQVATATFKGRQTAGTGNVEDLSVAEAKSLLGYGALADLDTVGESEIDAGAVHTAELATATDSDTFSVTCSSSVGIARQVKALSGGDYGLFVKTSITSVSGTDGQCWFGLASASSSTVSSSINISLCGAQVGSGGGVTGRTYNGSSNNTYISSSPPYDFGNGEFILMPYVLLNEHDEIVSVSLRETPPWIYNGPTNVRAEKVEGIRDKKGKLLRVKKVC